MEEDDLFLSNFQLEDDQSSVHDSDEVRTPHVEDNYFGYEDIEGLEEGPEPQGYEEEAEFQSFSFDNQEFGNVSLQNYSNNAISFGKVCFPVSTKIKFL